MLKLKPNYLLVFAVKNKKKFKGFYTPTKSSYADYYELMEVWIADMGPECHCITEGVGLGAKCYLLDVYELDTQVPLNIMKMYGDKVNFGEDIMKIAEDYDGDIEAFVIHENSLIAMDESTWKKNPILSWDQ